MIKKLINPFHYIAGLKSLILGVIIILLTSLVSYLSGTHFPDVISLKINAPYPVWYFIVQGLTNWISVSLVFYISSLLFSTSTVRIVDIFGTQALARAPYLVASFIGFSDSIRAFGNYLLHTLMQHGEPINISTMDIAFAVLLMTLSLFLTIWLITLILNALRVSANLKGVRLALVFTVGLIISILISGYLNTILINYL
jgi:hypothetical protein